MRRIALIALLVAAGCSGAEAAPSGTTVIHVPVGTGEEATKDCRAYMDSHWQIGFTDVAVTVAPVEREGPTTDVSVWALSGVSMLDRVTRQWSCEVRYQGTAGAHRLARHPNVQVDPA